MGPHLVASKTARLYPASTRLSSDDTIATQYSFSKSSQDDQRAQRVGILRGSRPVDRQ